MTEEPDAPGAADRAANGAAPDEPSDERGSAAGETDTSDTPETVDVSPDVGEATAGEEVSGSFLVTHADEETALLRDVETARVHPLSSNPGVADGVILEGTVRAEPPMGVTWELTEQAERREIPVEAVDLAVTTRCREVAADQPTGEVTRIERAGEGQLHVLTVPDDQTDAAVSDVIDDEATVVRAARLGVARVEVRSEPGTVVVRYLPE